VSGSVDGQKLERTDERMDRIMGTLLRTGVILAASVVFVGGVICLVRQRMPVTDYRVFRGEPTELRTISGIFHQAIALQGRGLIQLGLLILIATPIARVVFSVFAFGVQKDWKYVVFTVIVLALLCYGLFGG
jgi:uncharacterized membrane protein